MVTVQGVAVGRVGSQDADESDFLQRIHRTAFYRVTRRLRLTGPEVAFQKRSIHNSIRYGKVVGMGVHEEDRKGLRIS